MEELYYMNREEEHISWKFLISLVLCIIILNLIIFGFDKLYQINNVKVNNNYISYKDLKRELIKKQQYHGVLVLHFDETLNKWYFIRNNKKCYIKLEEGKNERSR